MVLAVLVNCVAAADERPGLTLQTKRSKNSFMQNGAGGHGKQNVSYLDLVLFSQNVRF
jgi:hypothetical protein